MFILETGSQKMILKVLIVRKKFGTYVAKLTYKKLYIKIYSEFNCIYV